MTEKAQPVGAGGLERCQPADQRVGVTVELATQGIDDGAKPQRHTMRAGYLPPEAFSALITFSVMSCFGLM